MKIEYARPPIYAEANALFKLEENKIAAVFTWGDTLFNPFAVPVMPDLMRHEETHMEQQLDRGGQEDGPKDWWRNYLQDENFRIDQEAEAYAMQYLFYCQGQKDRNWREKYLHQISAMLAGPMYGKVIKYQEARIKILDFTTGRLH